MPIALYGRGRRQDPSRSLDACGTGTSAGAQGGRRIKSIWQGRRTALRQQYRRGRLAGAVLLMGALSCRPVMTVSWTEIAILAVVVTVLLLPLLLRILRMLARAESASEADERDKGPSEN